jgi:hypothetical protein
MFEQELEMEKKSSSIIPLLLIVSLIVGVVGVAMYYVIQSRRVVSAAEAKPVIVASVENMPPATLRFATGSVKLSDNPHDPNYRLLEKAGFVTIGKDKNYQTPVALTEKGQAFLAQITGVKKSEDSGNTWYTVPLAQRKVADIGRIQMETPNRAIVEYTWKWETNQAGDLLDAAGPLVKGFSSYERTTLIDKYGANFYHAAPSKVTVALMKTDDGWRIATE